MPAALLSTSLIQGMRDILEVIQFISLYSAELNFINMIPIFLVCFKVYIEDEFSISFIWPIFIVSK